MARVLYQDVATDRAGNIIQNAAVFCYQPGTVTAPVGTMYTTATGGTTQSNPLISDAAGLVKAWFDTTQLLDVKLTDNANTAYYPQTPSSLLDFPDYTRPGVVGDPAHATKTPGAHAASAISFTPTGAIAGTDMQTALAEVASEATVPVYKRADLPTPGVIGRIAKVSDSLRGYWGDNGTAWYPIAGMKANIQDFGARSFVGDATIPIQTAINAALGNHYAVVTGVSVLTGTEYTFTVSEPLDSSFVQGAQLVIRDMVPIGYCTPNISSMPPGTRVISRAIPSDRLSFVVDVGSHPGTMTSTFGMASTLANDFTNNAVVPVGEIHVPEGNYAVSQTLRVNAVDGLIMRGDGSRGTAFHHQRQMETVLDLNGVAHSLVQGLAIQQGQVFQNVTASRDTGTGIVTFTIPTPHGFKLGYFDGSGTMDLSTVTYENGFVKVTTARDHGLSPGARVWIRGVTPATYDGWYDVTYAQPNKTLFLTQLNQTPLNPVASGGHINPNWIYFFAQTNQEAGVNGLKWENDYMIESFIGSDGLGAVPTSDVGNLPSASATGVIYVPVDKAIHWHWSNFPRPARGSTGVEFDDVKIFNGNVNRIGFAIGTDNNDQADEGTFYRCHAAGNNLPYTGTTPQPFRYQVGYQFGNQLYGNNLCHNVLASGAAGVRYGLRFDAVGGHITDWQSSLTYTVVFANPNGAFVLENGRSENTQRLIETGGPTSTPGKITIKGWEMINAPDVVPTDGYAMKLHMPGYISLVGVALYQGLNANVKIDCGTAGLTFQGLNVGSMVPLEEVFDFSSLGEVWSGQSGGYASFVIGHGLNRMSTVSGQENAVLETRPFFMLSPNPQQSYQGAMADHWLMKQSNTAPPTLGFKRSQGTNLGINTHTAAGDNTPYGSIQFWGNDGAAVGTTSTPYKMGAKIEALVTGVPSSTSMPGSLVFSTTPVSGTTPVERLRIGPAGAIEMPEISDPGNPGANVARLFVRDNGSGKTQWVARFSSGAVVVIATDP